MSANIYGASLVTELPPNTDLSDRNAMPSSQAEAARAKSAAVMAALKSSDPSAADKLMGPRKTNSSSSSEGGAMGWLKRKLSNQKSKTNPDGDNASMSTADSIYESKQGSKSDGVVR